jgi:hypothetical protein
VGNPSVTRLKQWVGLDSTERGKVLSSGWVSMLGGVEKTTDVDWLCGGVTIWHREVVKKYTYDEWFQGTGFMEDVDFSFRVGENYKLALVANARVAHYQHPVLPDRHYLLGKWQIVNRMYFVRKFRNRGMSLFQAWVSNISVILLNLILGIFRMDRSRLWCALGNVNGIGIDLLGKNKQIGGFLK